MHDGELVWSDTVKESNGIFFAFSNNYGQLLRSMKREIPVGDIFRETCLALIFIFL